MKKKRIVCMLIVLGALFCVANVMCAIFFRDDSLSNLFTAISGVVSGIATLSVGIIAWLQSKQYTFSSQKNQMIFQIKEEYKLFIEKSANICSMQSYATILVGGVLHLDDDINKLIEMENMRLSLLGEIEDLKAYMLGFKYCPLSTKDFIDELNRFQGFVREGLKSDETIEIVDEKSAEVFKKKNLRVAEELMNKINRIRKSRMKVMMEMQIILKGTTNCNSLKEIKDFENKVLDKSIEVQKELIFDKIKKGKKSSQ